MGNAQESIPEKDFRKSIGVDAVFVNNFLPLERSIGFSNPYEFHYFKFKSEDKFVRHAADLNLFVRDSKSDNDEDVSDQLYNVEYKISFGKAREAFKNAYILAGPEIVSEISFEKRVVEDLNAQAISSENMNSEWYFELGGGVFAGLEYRITERFSVYTELTYHIIPSYEIQKFKSESQPLFDFEDTTFQVLSRFRLPSSIILFYTF